MDIHQLKVFVNVVDARGFLSAAKKMHLSQSTVSAHIAALENELGKKLIRRTPRIFEVTREGEKLYKYATDILALHEKAVREVRGEENLLLKIGTSSVPSQYILPKVAGAFLEKEKGIRMEVVCRDSMKIIERVEEGSLDLGFVGTKTESVCTFFPVAKDTMVLALPATKEYRNLLEKGDLAEILKCPYLIRKEDSGTLRESMESLSELGLSEKDLNISVIVDNAETLRHMIVEGIGISIVSRHSVSSLYRQEKVLIYPLPAENFSRNIYLVYRPENFQPEIQKSFIRFVMEYFTT
ncbi:MAG: selenium metabolism-associated LysR family transcriptional regulator [Lachnospiraceae bacterium]|nr:selenium metabolism-associated LysR family transcriptional regulator [Lachnospiraceae bacterium]MDY5497704.1 selenium metabolism-associated LysR family transcriptional regulator [Anaerobutyricum sp.]